jgi:hypothetical protein
VAFIDKRYDFNISDIWLSISEKAFPSIKVRVVASDIKSGGNPNCILLFSSDLFS